MSVGRTSAAHWGRSRPCLTHRSVPCTACHVRRWGRHRSSGRHREQQTRSSVVASAGKPNWVSNVSDETGGTPNSESAEKSSRQGSMLPDKLKHRELFRTATNFSESRGSRETYQRDFEAILFRDWHIFWPVCLQRVAGGD